MPHTLLSADQIAAQGVGLLQREIVLPRYVWNATDYFAARHPGRKNDTVNLPVPAVLTAREYEWRTRNNPIVTDDLEETTVPIKLDKHPYSAVGVTDEEMTLDIVRFGEQITVPQVTAVAEKLEGYIATGLANAPWKNTLTWNLNTGTPEGAFPILLKARKILNDANVPKQDRICLVGSGVELAILEDDHLNRFDQSGSDDAFREAQIGRIAGFLVIQSNSIGEYDMFVYHRSAIAFAQLAPVVPDGVPFGSVQTAGGMSMRWIRDYDANFLRDRSVFSAFAGVSSVNDGGEDQTVTITGGPTGGTFTLTLSGQTTSAIPRNATADQVRYALEALSNVGPSVRVSGGPGPTNPWRVTFREDVAQMTATSSLTGGTSPAVTVTGGSGGVTNMRGLKVTVTPPA